MLSWHNISVDWIVGAHSSEKITLTQQLIRDDDSLSTELHFPVIHIDKRWFSPPSNGYCRLIYARVCSFHYVFTRLYFIDMISFICPHFPLLNPFFFFLWVSSYLALAAFKQQCFPPASGSCLHPWKEKKRKEKKHLARHWNRFRAKKNGQKRSFFPGGGRAWGCIHQLWYFPQGL